MNQSQQPGFYEQTLAAWKSGDDEFVKNALFAFEMADREYVERVYRAIYTLLQRPGLTLQQVASIDRMLLGLTRMPLRTPGLNVRISLISKPAKWLFIYSVLLNENTFSTESGGRDNFGLGSDAFNGSIFSVKNQSRQYSGWIIRDDHWPDIFSKLNTAKLEIEDYSGDQLLDWDHSNGSEFWEWIERHR